MDQQQADAVAQRAADTVNRLLDTPGLRRLTSLAQELEDGARTPDSATRGSPPEREAPEVGAARPGRGDRASSPGS
jgi:hypothetical protein